MMALNDADALNAHENMLRRIIVYDKLTVN